jgi:hypothetical protein
MKPLHACHYVRIRALFLLRGVIDFSTSWGTFFLDDDSSSGVRGQVYSHVPVDTVLLVYWYCILSPRKVSQPATGRQTESVQYNAVRIHPCPPLPPLLESLGSLFSLFL